MIHNENDVRCQNLYNENSKSTMKVTNQNK